MIEKVIGSSSSLFEVYFCIVVDGGAGSSRRTQPNPLCE